MVKKTKYPGPSGKEDAAINAGIARDPDNPEWTGEDFARARPLAEADPELAAMIRRSRGRPPVDRPRRQLTLRLDPSLIDAIKAGGKGYTARVERILRDAVVRGKL
ncbi:MAG: BrnA antitoxin family protein [Methylocella sp.]